MNIDDAVRAIESSNEFKLLRSLKGPSDWGLKGTNPTALTGLYVDVETTGLSTSKDEIVELCLLPFSYDPNTGEILDVDMANAIDELSDPGIPIPIEATQVHGITNEDVAGKTINSEAVRRLASRAEIIISHNASFDRRFLERTWPTLNYRLDCTAMKLFSQNQLDFFIWNDFAVVYHGDEASPEAWVNMHGRWGRISIESLDHECRWLPRDEFLARFGNLPPLPVEAFRPLRLLVA